MKFEVTANTDIGIFKDTNEDSLLVKHAKYQDKEILMAIVCDGMGGLAKGELASATVIREFSDWFDNDLAKELQSLDMDIIAEKWSLQLKILNQKILNHGKSIGKMLGTTFTGMLFVDDKLMINHVGDSRAYYIGEDIEILTEDQTVVAKAVREGSMTAEEAKTHKQRNVLIQCIGASREVVPDMIVSVARQGTYLICSDGFRHEITIEEIHAYLNPYILENKELMSEHTEHLISLVKKRNEKDNISAIVIKAK